MVETAEREVMAAALLGVAAASIPRWIVLPFHLVCLLVQPAMHAASAPCSLLQEVGRCRGYMPRWFFNSEKNECQRFIYSEMRACNGSLLSRPADRHEVHFQKI